MRILLSLMLLMLLVPACAPKVSVEEDVNLPAGTLSRAEVIDLFMDRTVESETEVKGRISLTYYSPTGEVRQLQDGDKRSGRWRVNKNARICLTMDDNEEQCRVIVREADGSYRKYVVKKSGKHKPVVTYRSFVAGNPKNL